MSQRKSLKLAFMAALMCMVVVVEAFPPCLVVIGRLRTCIDYLRRDRSGQRQPPRSCCSAVRSLNSEARTPDDRRAACKCLENAAMGTRGINYGIAAAMPRYCGVSIPYPISPRTNCNQVN